MKKKTTKTIKTKEPSKFGQIGGKAAFKKLGKAGMSRIGKLGAKARWKNKKAKKA